MNLISVVIHNKYKCWGKTISTQVKVFFSQFQSHLITFSSIGYIINISVGLKQFLHR